MTEEIIIDGVDVAGCKYYHYKGCTANNLCKCDSNLNICKNCYYKQLKHLEQENENLKKEIKRIGSNFIKKGDYARELEQENKELKEKAPMKLIAKNNTYRSVLEEINIHQRGIKLTLYSITEVKKKGDSPLIQTLIKILRHASGAGKS